MTVPPEVIEQLVKFLYTFVLGGLAIFVGCYIGHFMGGVMEDWSSRV